MTRAPNYLRYLGAAPTIGFAQIVALAMKHYKFAHDEHIVVTGRLRQLLKRGILPGKSAGRGNHVEYTYDEVRQVMIGMAMQRLGIGPTSAVELMNSCMTLRDGDMLVYNMGYSSLLINVGGIDRAIAEFMPVPVMAIVEEQRPEGVPEGAKWVTL